MNTFYRNDTNREVRFLFGSLLCRLWLDRRAIDDANERDDVCGVEASDAYQAFVRLFEERRWEKSVDAVFGLQWKPFLICDATVVHHVFESRWYGGWPRFDRPGDAGRLDFNPLMVECVDNARCEADVVDILVQGWGFAPLYAHVLLEMMRWSVNNPQPVECGCVPLPTPLPEMSRFWSEAQRRSGQTVLCELSDKIKRCVVCGHSTFAIDDTTTPRRYRCAHCDAPYGMKKKKTSVNPRNATKA